VVTEGYGQKLFQGADPLGRSFLWGDTEVQVVGVVTGMHNWGLADGGEDQVYVPYARLGTGFRRVVVFVKADGDPSALLPELRRLVWDLEPDLPIGETFTMTQRIDISLASPRFYAALLGTFASIALLLAAGGIYGSMSYSVGQRRRELGIRIALGAQRVRVVGMVIRQGAVLTGSGLAIGLAGAYAVTRALEAMVFGIGTADPPTFVAVAGVLAAVAVGATIGPALRAAEADPVEALRAE